MPTPDDDDRAKYWPAAWAELRRRRKIRLLRRHGYEQLVRVVDSLSVGEVRVVFDKDGIVEDPDTGASWRRRDPETSHLQYHLVIYTRWQTDEEIAERERIAGVLGYGPDAPWPTLSEMLDAMILYSSRAPSEQEDDDD